MFIQHAEINPKPANTADSCYLKPPMARFGIKGGWPGGGGGGGGGRLR